MLKKVRKKGKDGGREGGKERASKGGRLHLNCHSMNFFIHKTLLSRGLYREQISLRIQMQYNKG
jgi:hypothetical protein